MTKPTVFEVQARGEDLRNLLDHIAWTDTIKPEFDKIRKYYEQHLVASVLGQKVLSGNSVLTSEQLAGRIEGLNFVEGLLAKILREGQNAFKSLQNLQIPE